MKLIDIPPYRRPGLNYDPKEGHFVVREIVDNMRRKGQLEGVEMDIDDGYPTEHAGKNRDEEVLANITVGFLKRVREISEIGKYDAIVTSGAIEPGFFAGRMISKIPIAFCVHSAVHVASLIGDRFTIIQLHDVGAQIVRHFVDLYGLGHKLASVRYITSSSTYIVGFLHKYKKEERIKVPEIKKAIDDVVDHSIKAIEKDRADSIILGGPYFEIIEDDIRQGLDEAGYGEIQLICEVSSAVEMAKAMVNMRLIQSPRAYPSDHLKAKPEFR
jgi:Asp/Glu/hydantoin racemase